MCHFELLDESLKLKPHQYIAAMNSSNFFKDPNRIFNLDDTNIQLCVSTGQVRSIRETINVYEIAPGLCKSTLTFVGTLNANGSID